MDQLTIDTVPFSFVPGVRCVEFVVRIDEQAGAVHVDPANA
ncbi:hypothetical protein EDF24_1070 [Curtobacterium sp. PhB130]|nr:MULTISPECIES: hypothetical protein [unclassified Curtobacterium]ROP65120.1 hypothetical protein EDF55_1774 [Curtobacterium sp. ZW137]ROS78296.1 hypothetical protein EDF24_1070 [Curtobacterium sp. PhB130]TCK65387.1 hypothetical protein EDF27_0125 [Curtobacterium sp. PhB136]